MFGLEEEQTHKQVPPRKATHKTKNFQICDSVSIRTLFFIFVNN